MRLLQEQAEAEATDSADEVERHAIVSRLDAIQGSIAQFGKDLDAARGTQRAAAQAGEITKKAVQHHADVAAWDALAEALGPSGIPADLLSEALDPINERLSAAANESEWMRIGIEADMTITADGGRAYALLSESERWRADAMIAEAISRLTGLRLLVLDRADVLIGPERDRLLYWLRRLGRPPARSTRHWCS
ncbi:hypothetical protein [Cupriavidus basilensis]